MDPCPHSASPDSTRSRWCSYRRAGQPRDLCRARDPARSSPLKPAAEPGRMPRQDQPGECVFERGLGLAEDILHKLSLKGIRCKTAVNCWAQSASESIQRDFVCFSMKRRHWELEKPGFVPTLGGGLKKKGETRLRSPSLQCAQFAQQTPKSQQVIY